MNLAELEKKLIAAARTNQSSDNVPYAFEKRILAYVTARPVTDSALLWARALWRGAASCIAITLLLSAWTFFAPITGGSTGDLSPDVESTVLAAVDQEIDNSW
jgi:hypothetical protein